jgi:hypothetical protein
MASSREFCVHPSIREHAATALLPIAQQKELKTLLEQIL